MRGQFEFHVTWFYFCFDFVYSHARWGCYSIVCWRGWEGGVVLLKFDVQGQGGGEISDVDRQGWGILKIRQFL